MKFHYENNQTIMHFVFRISAENNLCDILNLKLTFTEPSDIYLIDLKYQLSVWEDKIQNYNSTHKTGVYHDYQDIKSKFLIRLDSIDVSHNSTRQAGRSKVYDRLFELTKKFEKKIHEGHETCLDCVQVKVVTINF